ncbi:MAG: hypothetical protein KDC28_01940 [Saprospiraceae bacterium]|mgnify:CR=1 FL=1|nr:hypothetical protein [Saprospiraceae bacterium]MCB9320910.1 hypothetical protein [Lewinellaceae bacterium]
MNLDVNVAMLQLFKNEKIQCRGALSSLLLILIILSSCNKDRIEFVEINSPEIINFIKRFAFERKTNLMLMEIMYNGDSTEIYLDDFRSSFDLHAGDEFGFLVDKKWQNFTPPLLKTRVNSIDIYIITGIEKICKSRNRYQRLLCDLKDRIYRSVESYLTEDDSFEVQPPSCSMEMPWKMVINYDATKMRTYVSRREGYGNFYYQVEEIRIDSSYMERYN